MQGTHSTLATVYIQYSLKNTAITALGLYYITVPVTDRSLLMEHDALFLLQLGIFYMYYYIGTIAHDMAFGKPVIGTGEIKLVTR